MKIARLVVLITVIALLLSTVSIGLAAPPAQEPSNLSSLNETLSFNNLGTIMSGRNNQVDDPPAEDGDDDAGSEPGEPEPDAPDGEAIKQHPVAAAIAEYFGVTYDEVMALHEAGNGFGGIAKAYFFADKLSTPLTPEELLEAAHQSGWGNVLKENGIHPGAVGKGAAKHPDGPPGQVNKGNGNGDAADSTGENLTGQGGNGNQGNGNGHGNGQDKPAQNNGQGRGQKKKG
jgi:hypothetical protein